MTPALFVAMAMAGGLGAGARFLLDGAIRSRTNGGLPLGTIVINVSGSFALGLLTGAIAVSTLPSGWAIVVGTGFLGGYTTFSTASFETVRLLQDRKLGAAAINGVGVLVAAALAAGLGLWLGSLA